MLKHIKDLANLCTLLGLCLGLTGIYLSIIGYTTLALVALLLAVLCDIFDGIIARAMKNRISQSSAIGSQLDSLADLIHSGMGPTLVVGSWYGWPLWYLLPACLLIMSGAIRLANYNVVGLNENGSFQGLPIFYCPIIISIVFLLKNYSNILEVILVITILLISLLQVANIQIPKLKGWALKFLVVLIICLSAYYAFINFPPLYT